MGQNNFGLSSSEEAIHASAHCARCGNTAEIHLALLDETPQRSGSFCLTCGEALLHELQNQFALFGHTGAHSKDTYPSFAYTAPHPDDSDHGIIFWEGHGWSSDGPFAGA